MKTFATEYIDKIVARKSKAASNGQAQVPSTPSTPAAVIGVGSNSDSPAIRTPDERMELNVGHRRSSKGDAQDQDLSDVAKDGSSPGPPPPPPPPQPLPWMM